MELSIFSDEYFMAKALEEAKAAYDEGEVPVGAVVVCNNRIVGKGHNQVERLNDVTAHAEMLAITAASNFLGSKVLTNCKLFVTLEPCAMCATAIYNARIGQLVYGAKDDKKGYTLYTPSLRHPKSVVKKGILEEQCSDLLKQFFEQKRKKK